MNTEKAKQHYVPKFYLRNFSYQNNKKQIGIFNLNNSFFYPTATLKDEGCRQYFYGKDGQIENALSNIEGVLSSVVNQICTSQTLPTSKSRQHWELLYFVVLTLFRNPILSQNITDGWESSVKARIFGSNVVEESSTDERDSLVVSSLLRVEKMVENCEDLAFKILKNKTSTPFIASDNPVIKYNQFLESRKSLADTNSLISIGAQIFVPLNDEILIAFFDSWAYKFGNKKSKIIEIDSVNEINQINTLQFLNCIETVYFNHKATESYIKSLSEKAKYFNKANTVKTQRIPEMDVSGQIKSNSAFIITTISGCKINLKLSFVKQRDDAKKFILTNNKFIYSRSNYRR